MKKIAAQNKKKKGGTKTKKTAQKIKIAAQNKKKSGTK